MRCTVSFVVRFSFLLAVSLLVSEVPAFSQTSIKLLYPAGREYSIVKGQKATLYHYSTTGFGDINGDGIPAAITSVKAVDDSSLQWVSLRPDFQSNTELIPPQDSLIFFEGSPTFGSAVTVDATHLLAGRTYRFTVTSCTEPPVGGTGFRPCASVANLSVTVLPIPISLISAISPNGSMGTVRLFWKPAANPDGIISLYSVLARDEDSISIETIDRATILQPNVVAADTLLFVTGKRSVPSWYSIAGFDSSGELVGLSESRQPNIRFGTFSQLSPSDGAVITTPSTTLTWEGVPGEKFELWYGEDSTFAVKTIVRNLIPNSYHLPDTLQDHQVFYWQVRTMKGIRSNQSGWNFSFNRENLAPQAFTLMAPAEGDTVHSSAPEFRWEAAVDPGDTLVYHIFVSSAPLFSDTILAATVRQPSFTPLHAMGNRQAYYWKVVAEDSRGVMVESGPGSFVVGFDVPPGAPGLVSPIANAGTQYVEFPTEASLEPTLVWKSPSDSLAGVVTYTILYDTSVHFTNPAIISDVSSTSYQFAVPLLEDQHYFWKVEARDQKGAVSKNFGLPAMFVTNAVQRNPDPAVLIEPANGAQFGVGGVSLSWFNPGDDIYDTHIFDVIVTNDTTQDEGSVPPVYSGLLYQTDTTFYPTQITKYFWRIRTRSVSASGGPGGVSYSAWRSFLFTGDLAADETQLLIPQRFELLQNYPNPFNPATEIGYAVLHRTRVRIDVFNTVGERVASLVDGEIEPGWHSIRWNAERMASGVYYCRMQWAGGSMSRKLLLVK